MALPRQPCPWPCGVCSSMLLLLLQWAIGRWWLVIALLVSCPGEVDKPTESGFGMALTRISSVVLWCEGVRHACTWYVKFAFMVIDCFVWLSCSLPIDFAKYSWLVVLH